MLKHGAMRGNRATPEYTSWKSMKERCLNPKNIGFQNYGGRGIRIFEAWLGEHGFEEFLAHMRQRPSLAHSLDRYPDTNGNYEPGNVRWATVEQQARNKTSNRNLTFDGRTMTLAEWARERGLRMDTLHRRIVHYGWPVDEALSVRVHGGSRSRASAAHTYTGDRQLAVLSALASADALRPMDLPDIGGGKRLRRLVERGLIERLPGGNAAKAFYRLTVAGRMEMQAARESAGRA